MRGNLIYTYIMSAILGYHFKLKINWVALFSMLYI